MRSGMGPKYCTEPLTDVEVVGQCDAVAALDFLDLVFAITVESRPFDALCRFVAPIPYILPPFVRNAQLPALVGMWQTHNQRTKMSSASRSINVGAKST